jgi:hypothetical protein
MTAMDRFASDFDRIFSDVDHDYRCPIQRVVESGKQLSAAANRFAAPDDSAAATRIATNGDGND